MSKHRSYVLAVAGVSVFFLQHAGAVTLQEDFSSDPSRRGWQAVGQADLFSWNSNNQNLEVTWDSSKSNSFYCRPLGTILAASDNFNLEFDLRLTDVAVGVNPAKPYSFELGVGLINLSEASRTNFLRGSGSGIPDLIEFDYFPDDGSGFPSLDATLSDTNSILQFYYVNVALDLGETYRVMIEYQALTKSVQTTVTHNGAPYCTLTNSFLNGSFADYRLDHVAICSYSDEGQDPQFGGSILAHGVIDNLVLNLPDPPVTDASLNLDQGLVRITFASQTTWLYNLERTTDFQTWAEVGPMVPGNGSNLVLQDTNAPGGSAFYRVIARRP